MRLMKSTITFAVGVALATFLSSNAMAASEASVKQAWQAQDAAQLRATLPNRDAVDSLVKELYGDTVVQPTVGEYEIANLNDDGTVELIVTVDFSGRGFYNTVNIISYANGKLHSDTIKSDGITITDLKSRIVDLNGDGMHELLVPRALAPYAGANPIPVIDDVYQWNGTGYAKADGNFKNYYRDKVMPRLNSAIDAISHGHSSANAQTNEMLKKKYNKELDEVSNILND